MQKLNPLLSVPDLAEWINIKQSTIRKWVFYRKNPYVAVGRSIRFREEDVEAWLTERSVKSEGHVGQVSLRKPICAKSAAKAGPP